MNIDQIVKLKRISQQLRKSVIRELSEAGSGHSAGCLGFADVMAVLYFYAMRLDPDNPNWEDRLLRTDLQMKTTSVNPWLLVETALVGIGK